jgi:ABC-2 type transport system ATP-binding protein
MSAAALPRPGGLSIRGVTIRYEGGNTAVRELSLDLVPGEVFGLVGPNGAGKSSLLNCAAGLIAPQSGVIYVGEENITGRPRRAAHHLALMPDPLGVYLDISAAEYMTFFAKAYDLPPNTARARIAHAVERLGLGPWLDYEVEALSSGWQRRLALSRVLIADAPIVLLDEPASGLDVSGRRELLKLVRGFAVEGRAVLVTSHILPELEELADRFGIIQKGRWMPVREGQIFFTRAELRAGFTQNFWRLECSDPASACALLGPALAVLEPGMERIRLTASSRDEAANLVEQLVRAGQKIYHLEAAGRSLDEVTLQTLREDSKP